MSEESLIADQRAHEALISGGTPPPPHPSVFAAYESAHTAPVVARSAAPLWLSIAGAAVAGLGAFLPWISAVTMFGSLSVTGMQGDGKLSLVLAIVAAVLVWAGHSGPNRWITRGLGACGTGIAFIGAYDMQKVMAHARLIADDGVTVAGHVAPGAGLVLTIAAGLALVVAAGLTKRA
jgi:hypothetical protein